MAILSTKYRLELQQFLTKYRNAFFAFFAVLSIIVAIVFFSLYLYTAISNSKKSTQLHDIINQDIELYKTNEYTKNLYSRWDTIEDMIALQSELRSEKDSYINYQQALARPYNYLMNYILLPSLNIWKDPYTKQIDTTLIGSKFLSSNPFTDLALIERWTRVFQDIETVSKQLGINSSNEIKDIQIGTIVEQENGFFSIPISLSFESANRRSFLLLMEKLSMTSHHKNITLINEFILNLWENIKYEYAPEIDSYEIKEGEMASETNIDKKLGYLLFQRVKHSGPNFVNDFAKQRIAQGETSVPDMQDLIEKSIRTSAGCTDQSVAECEYLFREKFRTVPYLIYPITNARKNKSDTLHEFLQNTIPPVIKVREFTFNEQKTDGPLTEAKYNGIIQIDVYGRGISDDELSEIAVELGAQCLGDNKVLSFDTGLIAIDQAIIDISKIDILDTKRSQELFELKGLFIDLKSKYDGLTQYNKVVKLFEAYRMLDDGSLCK